MTWRSVLHTPYGEAAALCWVAGWGACFVFLHGVACSIVVVVFGVGVAV